MNTKTFIHSIFTLVALCATEVQCHGEHEDVVFNKVAKELPLALSDMTATYIADFKDEGSEAIILTGGCSDENGNSEVIDGGKTNYYCNEISKSTYVFYPSTYNIVQLKDMPVERYRHSAAYVNGKLYVIGGRQLIAPSFDELVNDIHVYDPKTDDWSLFMTLPTGRERSDQASFGKDGNIYVVGGYSGTGADYVTHNEVFSINVETKEILSLASMKTKRGDAQAVYYNSGGIEAIYTMGGFSTETTKAFCEPLADAEKYDFSTNKWTSINPLSNQRGDKGVVILSGRILAIGGEDKHESLCAGTEDEVDAHTHAVAVDDVESYDPQDGDDPKWVVESDFAEFRFRSAAAVAEKLDTVFVFGGQMAYDPDCRCFKTSKDIFFYRDKGHTPNGSDSRKIGFVTAIAVSLATLFSI